jgi:hypothetical protein
MPFEGLIRGAVRDGVERTVRNLKCLVEAEKTGRLTASILGHAGASPSRFPVTPAV